jgi:hypothetical protein
MPPPDPDVPAGFGVASLLMGIVGVVLFWVPIAGLLLPILAMVFGGLAVKFQSGPRMGLAGLILGAITLLVFVSYLALNLS